MPFTKIDIDVVIDEKIKNELEFAKAYAIIEKEYKPVEEAVKLSMNQE